MYSKGSAASAPSTSSSTIEPVPIDQVVTGSPATGSLRSARSRGHEVGVWEMTPGAMSDVEADELFVVVSGRATVEFVDTGTWMLLGPGDVVQLRAGARTVWTVHRDAAEGVPGLSSLPWANDADLRRGVQRTRFRSRALPLFAPLADARATARSRAGFPQIRAEPPRGGPSADTVEGCDRHRPCRPRSQAQRLVRRTPVRAEFRPWRLRSSDIEHPFHGVNVLAERRHADSRIRICSHSASDYHPPDCVLASGSATRRQRSCSVFRLPLRMSASPLHVSVRSPRTPPRTRGVVGHKVSAHVILGVSCGRSSHLFARQTSGANWQPSCVARISLRPATISLGSRGRDPLTTLDELAGAASSSIQSRPRRARASLGTRTDPSRR